MARELTDGNFQTEVLDKSTLSVVKFGAAWCGPCRALKPVIEGLAKEYADVVIGDVDVDTNPTLSMNYGITSIPAVLFIKGGEVVDKMVGAQSKSSYAKKIEEYK